MSDHADNADSRIYRTIAAGLAVARRTPTLKPGGRCHFCDEAVANELLFCNRECRDDFERHMTARKILGCEN